MLKKINLSIYIFNSETLEIYFCNPKTGVCRQMVFTKEDTDKYFWNKDDNKTNAN